MTLRRLAASLIAVTLALAARAETTEEHFKNIKVLKGYPADDLVPAMQFISASLGVDCDYCHVDHAPEKDDKMEKQTARKMIAMVFAINRENFEGKREVTCVTCHHGSPEPIAVPPIGAPAAAAPATEASKPPAAIPSVDSIMTKYLQASGGGPALAKLFNRVQKGKLSGFGPEPMPVEVFAKVPDKRISIVHGPRGDNVTAFDGTNGWLAGGGRPGARDMGPGERQNAKLEAMLQFPRDVRSIFKEVKVAPNQAIDGHDAMHLVGRNEGQPPVELWYDAQSGLLVRQLRFVDTPLGRNPTRVDYGDYRAVDGVMVAHRWTVSRPDSSFTIQIDQTQQNVTVEDSRFAKPSEPPPQGERK